MLNKPFVLPSLKRSTEDADTATKRFRPNSNTSIQRPALEPVVSNPQVKKSSKIESDGIGGQYIVLWRKLTTKKNKTWDGDGTLTVKDGTARLNDISGREMGCIPYKNPILPGSMLFIAGKEVEVDSVVPRSMLDKSKSLQPSKAFHPKLSSTTASQLETPTHQPLKILKPSVKPHVSKPTAKSASHFPAKIINPQQINRPFSRPFNSAFKKPLNEPPRQVTNSQSAIPIVRHDPNQPGAFVLPRIQDVPKGKQVVDVVVDPILAKHLRPHQKEGVTFLYECVMGIRMREGQGAILADEMGVGKTIQTIALIWTLLKQNPISGSVPVASKILVVCPVSVAMNWKKEIRKWLGADRIGVFLMRDKKSKLTDFTKGRAYNVMIVGFEKFRTIADDLASQCNIDLVVIDEGHLLKSTQNKASIALKSFTDRRIMLTGTPLQNDLKEFHSLVDLINPGILGKYNSFKKKFEDPIHRARQKHIDVFQTTLSHDSGEDDDSRIKEFAELTSQFMLRRTATVNEKYLPPKTEMVLFCRPTSVQLRLYSSILDSPLYSRVLGSTNSSLQLIGLLKRICNSPALVQEETESDELIVSIQNGLVSNRQDLLPDQSSKLSLLKKLLLSIRENTKEKVVIVSNYTKTLDIIEPIVSSTGCQFLRLDGAVSSTKRQDIVDNFNKAPADKLFALLLSAKAGGIGLNLVGASRLFLMDTDWNPATDMQAMARIHRPGQTLPCFIYRLLLKGTLEEKIFQRQITKIELSNAVVDSKQTVQGFSTEDLRDLFRLDQQATCQTHSLLGCACGGLGNVQEADDTEAGRIDHRDWGATMNDDAADEKSGSLQSYPGTGFISSSDALEMQEKKNPALNGPVSQAKLKLLSLMQFLHIDCKFIVQGNEDVEMLVEDPILLSVIKQNRSRIDYIFSKRTG